MIKKIPFRAAINGALLLISLIIVFHLLVVTQIIPYTIVWGGRLNSVKEMLRFEFASIAINGLLIIVISIKGGYVQLSIPSKTITPLLWLFIALFSLNTIGNLMAKMTTETIVFTPVTVILAILCLRIVLEQK